MIRYTENDIGNLARGVAKGKDPRATRISWELEVTAGAGALLVVFFRAGGKSQSWRVTLGRQGSAFGQVVGP